MTSRDERRKAIGLRLKESRLGASYTQEDVARLLGLKSGATVSSWERGKSMPKADEWYALGPMLGVSLDYLVYGIRTIPASREGMMGVIFRQQDAAQDDQVKAAA